MEIFQVGIYWVGIFRVGIFQGGVWWVGIFRVGVFLTPNFWTVRYILNCKFRKDVLVGNNFARKVERMTFPSSECGLLIKIFTKKTASFCYMNKLSFENKWYSSRSSHQRYSIEKLCFKILPNLQENTCFIVSRSLVRSATLLKKRLWQRCFLVSFSKFLKTPSLQNNSGRLLLVILVWMSSGICNNLKSVSQNSSFQKNIFFVTLIVI